MTKADDKQEEKRPLTLSRPGKLELKKTVEGGQVRQNFSHGRSKMVAVEVRKKRTFTTDSGGEMTEVKGRLSQAADSVLDGTADEAAEHAARTGDSLTTDERAARMRALQDSQEAAAGRADAADLDAPLGAPAPPPEDGGSESAAALDGADDGAAAGSDDEIRRKAEQQEETRREVQAMAAAEAAAAKLLAVEGDGPDKGDRARVQPRRAEPRRQTPDGRRGQPRRRSGKLTIDEALGVREERTRSLASVRRAREKEKQKLMGQPAEAVKVVRDVVIPEVITVQELANRMAERGADVVKSLMQMGVMATINQTIDGDTAELVVVEFGHNLKRVSDADVEAGLKGLDDENSALISRAPVVTVMGHVDHGKTSLLDALRETDVAAGESGGITQHIGAYQVTMPSNAKITFIDTPGHEAFTDMRARGASVTDIVVLVVAADDGVMPQTIEAIDHAKAAKVPIIVAINKIDLPDANSDRIRTELLQHDLVVESMGGDVLCIEVSAKQKINLDKLEEAILLQSEILDLRANPARPADGVIVEARTERGRGTVATVLVQRGTLRVGDIFVAGQEWGRVRALMDSHGQSVEEAGPAVPVEALGLGGTPAAGDDVVAVDDESRAREVTEFRERRTRNLKSAAGARGTLEEMLEKIKEGDEVRHLPVVIKADVHGSVEAIIGALEKMSTDEVQVQVLHSGVGGINESDVILARASGGLIIGFNVRANPQARDTARQDNVEIRYYSIIYNVLDDLKGMLSGMLSPTIQENFLGNAEVREVFNITKVGKVAGCFVKEGMVRRGARVRLVRDDVVIHEGEMAQLKRFKDDAKEVKEGMDCGVTLASYQDVQVGDTIECFEVEEIARQL